MTVAYIIYWLDSPIYITLTREKAEEYVKIARYERNVRGDNWKDSDLQIKSLPIYQ